jgi:hypothetical protein
MLLLAVWLTACGARSIMEKKSPRELLEAGRYAEARAAALEAGLADQTNRAIVALSHIAETPTSESAEKAVSVLADDARNVRAAATAMEMLELTFVIPQPVTPEVSILAAEAALGAVSYGPLAITNTPSITVGAASRDLAVAVLERVAEPLMLSDVSVQSDRLLAIWNSCFSLDGGTFEAQTDFNAWRLFRSISTIALFVNRAQPTSDFANVLLGASVTVIESNPEISVAARCDLGSPFEDLKSAMSHKREEMGRLEKSVTKATGCTRGTYAPTAP